MKNKPMVDPSDDSKDLDGREGVEAPSDDLLSFLLTMLENIWLLVGTSVSAGLIALALAWSTPARYISTALIDPVADLPLDIDHQSFPALRAERQKLLPLQLASPETLKAARETAALPGGAGDVLAKSRSNGTVTLQVRGSAPESTKALANAVISAALERTRPSTTELTRLNAEFKAMSEQLQTLSKAGEALRARLAAADAAVDVSGQIASNMSVIVGNLGDLERRMAFNRLISAGAGPQVVIEAPSDPIRLAGLTPLAWMAIGLVAGLMLGLTWVFLRETFRQYRPSPEQAARLRSVLGRLLFIRRT